MAGKVVGSSALLFPGQATNPALQIAINSLSVFAIYGCVT